MNTVVLPQAQVKAQKDAIWSTLAQPDSGAAGEAYARLVSNISHPAAVFRGRAVRGTLALQRRLNLLIFGQRVSWLFVLAFAFTAFVTSWVYLIACPLIVLFNLFVVQNLQTRINVELAARLYVLDGLMLQDHEFNKNVLAAMGAEDESDGELPA